MAIKSADEIKEDAVKEAEQKAAMEETQQE
jgi:hypothetical protein